MSEPTTYSPGLEGVIAGETTIARVTQTGLEYRGYPIEELGEQCSFEEVAHLLLYAELPNRAQVAQFKKMLDGFRPLPREVVDVLRMIPTNAPLMEVLRTTVSMCGHFDPIKGVAVDDLRRRAVWLTAVIAGIIAARHRLVNHKQPLDPKPGLSHAAQLLYQAQGEVPSERTERLLDMTLVLYAEHDYNASTFTHRVICSTMSDQVSATVGAIGALKGPLHGGANEESMQMLLRFKDAAEASKWVQQALAKKEKIMGFGHRVYKHGDHRAWMLEAEMRKLAEEKGMTKWVEIYDAIKDPIVSKEHPIYPNVDYPCGLTYYMMGLPLDLYTPLFVAARTTGWSAHYIEQYSNNRIYRPISQYTGPETRKVAPIDQR